MKKEYNNVNFEFAFGGMKIVVEGTETRAYEAR